MDPSGKSLSTSNEVNSARVDRATFSSESGASAPKGVTAPTGVATRNSQLRCMVLTFPASSFTSYAGTPSATWQTTTYSVSLQWSFCFPCYASFFISTTLPSTNCAVLMVLLCRLKPHSLKCGHRPILVVTRVIKCGLREPQGRVIHSCTRGFSPWIPMCTCSWHSTYNGISRRKGQIGITTLSHCALP